MKRGYWLLAGVMAVSMVQAAEEKGLDPTVNKLLTAAGAVTYAQKADYGSGIDSMVLGFDKDGAPIIGIASKETKTYKKAVTIVAVVPADGKYKISAAEIPDIASFHGKSQDLTKQALKDITGKVLADEAAAKGIVDAVTGATKYLQAIYVSYSLMAGKVIAEIKAKPAWERKPLAVQAPVQKPG